MNFKKTFDNVYKFLRMIHNITPKVIYVGAIKALIAGLLPYISIVYYAIIIDSVLVKNYQGALFNVALMLVFTFAFSLIYRASLQYINANTTIIHEGVVAKTMYKAYTMEYDVFEKHETMQAIQRARNGTNSSGGCDSLFKNLVELLERIISVMIGLVIIGLMLQEVYHPSLFEGTQLIMLIAFIGAIIFSIAISYQLNKKNGRLLSDMLHHNEKSNSQSNYFSSKIHDYKNAKDIRIFKMQEMLLDIYGALFKQSMNVYTNWSNKTGKNNGLEAFMFTMSGGIVYLFIAYQALIEMISIGSVLKYAQNIIYLMNSCAMVISVYENVAFTSVYLSNFEKFIAYQNTHFNNTLPTEKRADNNYIFEFKDVSFKYPNTNELVLDKVNLVFEVGKKKAIIGQNGAGKTTLVKLLCRLYEPLEGEILLNGIDISKYDYNEYMDLFAVVFQDFKLFSLPLVQNVCCSLESDMTLFNTVIKQVGIEDVVNNLPLKEQTYLNKDIEEGIELSGGQAQKIAIARALYKDAPFVILDEPTSALDPISEAEIYDRFNDMVKNKTAIYISHRMSSCRFCDEVVVFENGKIIQVGTHDKLLEEDGLYKALWNAQAQYYS